MSAPDVGSIEETERLLAAGSAGGAAGRAGVAAAPDAGDGDDASVPLLARGDAAVAPVTHYSSLSVDRAVGAVRASGSVQIVERDVGGPNDLFDIHVDLLWKPRGGVGMSPLDASVDELLTLRLVLAEPVPCVTLHLRGGALAGEFMFPNGPDAAMAFVTTLRAHVHTAALVDPYRPGELFALEKKDRMRRVAPSLMEDRAGRFDDQQFADLLEGLNLQSPSTDGRRRSRRGVGGPSRDSRISLHEHAPPNVGLLVLEQFAKITRVARDVKDDLSILFDEKKRNEELARKERERAARRRALDIYADIVASSEEERDLPPRFTLDDGARGLPVSRENWMEGFNAEGRLVDPTVMRQAIFAGGLEPELRPDAWPFLLDVYAWDSTSAERRVTLLEKESAYRDLVKKWKSLQSAAKASDAAALSNDPDSANKDRRSRVSKTHADYLETEEQIAKDIVRTDRRVDLYKQDNAPALEVMGDVLNVYAVYDKKIRYCQGMSDFVSPILHVFGVDEEALVFWCFESLMQRIEGNFRIDQTGMRAQLTMLKDVVDAADSSVGNFFNVTDPDYYCCFRWLLVRFKRELSYEATARMWEVFWTRHAGGDNIHIFVAAGLLLAHRRQLLALEEGGFDTLLRYVNDLSGRIDVDFALREGELCFRKYGPGAVPTSSRHERE